MLWHSIYTGAEQCHCHIALVVNFEQKTSFPKFRAKVCGNLTWGNFMGNSHWIDELMDFLKVALADDKVYILRLQSSTLLCIVCKVFG